MSRNTILSQMVQTARVGRSLTAFNARACELCDALNGWAQS